VAPETGAPIFSVNNVDCLEMISSNDNACVESEVPQPLFHFLQHTNNLLVERCLQFGVRFQLRVISKDTVNTFPGDFCISRPQTCRDLAPEPVGSVVVCDVIIRRIHISTNPHG